MPPRENPTARQVRLGVELRKLRERAGRTAREAAAMLGTDQGKISHIESGRIGVSEERIRRLAAFYECTDEALLSALCAMARERRGQFWWDEYRGKLAPRYLDIAELEHHAVVKAGELFYIPAGMPHLPANLGNQPATAVIARTDPNEQESVVLLPQLEERVPA